MRTVLTLTAAVVINAAALAAVEWNASTQAAQLAPAGVVTISQIDESTPVAPLAQAKVDGQVTRTANSL